MVDFFPPITVSLLYHLLDLYVALYMTISEIFGLCLHCDLCFEKFDCCW